MIIVYGRTSSSGSEAAAAVGSQDQVWNDTGSTIFVVMTKSPLWCNYKTGKINDFFVGDGHVLLELAPKARALWCSHPSTKFADLVGIHDSHTLSFGRSTTAPGDSQDTGSGLHIDFEAGVVSLRHAPSNTENREGDYVEVDVGPQGGPPRKLDRVQPWETVIHLRKIEVYSFPNGVENGLGTARSVRPI